MSPDRRPQPSTATTLHQITELLDLRRWLHAHADDWQPGYGTGSDNTGRQAKGEHTDPTGNNATNPHTPQEDMLTRTAQQLIKDIDQLCTNIEQLMPTARQLTPMTNQQAHNKEAETNTRRLGSGTCLKCGTHVTGVDPDRLRAGYCGTCYQQWVRLDRPDRGEFQHQRGA